MEATKAKEVCPTTTQGLIKQGALLVDVRELNEINEVSFDVPRILLIPLSELEDRWQEIPKEGDVIFVCAAGVKSLKATYYLMNRGYTNVMNMEHGMDRWIKKGFPTKGNVSAVSSQNADSCCSTSSTEKVESSCCGTSSKEKSSSESSCCSTPSKDGTSCC
ncbi:MAG: rhodanese-like domain-containing protein [Leptospiraceae bacterium]|jgi:rhodanese-related sulfurtransferase|nr:rhodanese-like domain-containing protein [Leptospiraceae bacterium]MBK9503507.1 rhodanese-like domain-containing protein [Leptospiraceae bacterium]